MSGINESVQNLGLLYGQFVKAAEDELQAVGGDISKADAAIVATLSGSDAEKKTYTVGKSATDKAYSWGIRSKVDRSANNRTHTVFKDAVASLFGGKEENIPAHIREQMTKFEGTGGTPLSARRIVLISREVEIALAGRSDLKSHYDGDALNAEFNRIAQQFCRLGEVSERDLRDVAQLCYKLLELMTEDITSVCDARQYTLPQRFVGRLDGLKSGLKALGDNLKEGETWTGRYRALVELIRGQKDSLKAELNGADDPAFKGSRDESVMYSLLENLKAMDKMLGRTEHFLKLPELKQKINELRDAGIELEVFKTFEEAVSKFCAGNAADLEYQGGWFLEAKTVAGFLALVNVDKTAVATFRQRVSDDIDAILKKIRDAYTARRPKEPGPGGSFMELTEADRSAIKASLLETYNLKAMKILSANPQAALTPPSTVQLKRELSIAVLQKFEQKVGEKFDSCGRKIEQLAEKVDGEFAKIERELADQSEVLKDKITQLKKAVGEDNRHVLDLAVEKSFLRKAEKLSADYAKGGKDERKRIEDSLYAQFQSYISRHSGLLSKIKNKIAPSLGFADFLASRVADGRRKVAVLTAKNNEYESRINNEIADADRQYTDLQAQLANLSVTRQRIRQDFEGKKASLKDLLNKTVERMEKKLGEPDIYQVQTFLDELAAVTDGLEKIYDGLPADWKKDKLGYSYVADPQGFALPNVNKIGSRIPLTDPNALADYFMETLQNTMLSQIESTKAEENVVSEAAKEDLRKRLNQAFADGKTRRLREICVNLCTNAISMPGLQATVPRFFRDMVGLMLSVMTRTGKDCKFNEVDLLPDVTQQQTVEFRKAELASRLIDLGGEGGASGFQEKFASVVDKLIRIGSSRAIALKDKMNKLVLMLSIGDFDASDPVATAGSTEGKMFEDLYRKGLDKLLDTAPTGKDLTRRKLLEAVFEELEAFAAPQDDGEDVLEKFFSTCDSLVSIVPDDAFQNLRKTAVSETREALQRDPSLSDTKKVIYKMAGGNSDVDYELCMRDAVDRLKLDRDTIEATPADRLQLMLDISRSGSFFRNSSSWHLFFRQLATDPQFPVSYLTPENSALLLDLLYQYEVYLTDPDAQGGYRHLFAGSVGTFDAKAILLDLAEEGLLTVPGGKPYALAVPAGIAQPGSYGYEACKKRCSSRTLLSDIGGPFGAPKYVIGALVYLNGGQLRGINEVCQRVFHKDIRLVTEADLEKAFHIARINNDALQKDDSGEATVKIGGNRVKLSLFVGVDPYLALSENTAKVVDLFTGKRPFVPSTLDVKPVVDLQTAKEWWAGFKAFAAKPGAPLKLKIGGVEVTYSRVDGRDRIQVGNDPNEVYFVGAGLNGILASLQRDIIDGYERYPQEKGSGIQVLRQLLPATAEGLAGMTGARDICVALLDKFTRISAAEVSHISTRDLFEIVTTMLKGTAVTPAEITAAKKAVHAKKREGANSKVVLEQIAVLENTQDVDKIVKLHYLSAPSDDDEAAFAKQLKGFAADLVMNEKTWVDDGQPDAAGRIKAVVTAHAGLIGKLIAMNDDERKACFSFLPSDQMRNAVLDVLGTIRTSLGANPCTVENLAAVKFDELAQKIEEASQRELGELQDFFVKEFVDKFAAVPVRDVDKQTLRELAGTDNIDMSKGYGAFLKTVFSNYFKPEVEVQGEKRITKPLSPLKRQILSSYLREVSAGADTGAKIKALVNHAGPVFLKLLQGVPPKALPRDLAPVLADVYDNLPSISPVHVQAQMLDIVKRSNNAITGIDVIKPIGAASVGQAFLCRMRSAANPEGVECVVKLLRPYAQNFADYEMTFMRGLAGPGLRKTLEGRFKTILEELDLSKEAENVKRGGVYDPKSAEDAEGIFSMKLFGAVLPTDLAMVMMKAPGKTCKEFFAETDATVAGIAEKTKVVDVNTGITRYQTENLIDYLDKKNQLRELYVQTEGTRKRLSRLVRTWVHEAVFGDGRFYHGDLHLGNIMTDGEILTVIDFGNAGSLTPKEQDSLRRVLLQCAAGNTESFLDRLADLLPKAEAGAYSSGSLPQAARKELEKVLHMGSLNDLSLRLCAAVNILQAHNVVVPSVIVNITQSMQRLQNAIEAADATLGRIQALMGSMEIKPGGRMLGDPASDLEKAFFGEYDTLAGFVGNARKFAELTPGHYNNNQSRRSREILAVLKKEIRTLDDYEKKFKPLWKKAGRFVLVHPGSRKEYGQSYITSDTAMASYDFVLSFKETYKQPGVLEQNLYRLAQMIAMRLSYTPYTLFNLENTRFDQLPTFSEVVAAEVRNYVNHNMLEATFELKTGATTVKGANDIAEKEQEAIARLNRCASAYVKKHREISLDIASEILKVVTTGVKRLPDGKKVLTDAEQSKNALAIMQDNLKRLKAALQARDSGFAFGEDHPGWVAARELFSLLFGMTNDMFDRAKALEGKTFEEFWAGLFAGAGAVGNEVVEKGSQADIKAVFSKFNATRETEIEGYEEEPKVEFNPKAVMGVDTAEDFEGGYNV